MEPDFWRQSWSEGRTGFHQADYNRHLVAYAERMPKGRVLVPLAGKTRDIAFLTQSGYEVVAVELVPSAVEAFFEAAGIAPERAEVAGHPWQGRCHVAG